jgi:hypothetical protein
VNKVLAFQEVWATQDNNGNNWMFVAYNGYDNSEDVIAQTEGFGPGVPWNSMTFLTGQFAYDSLSRLFSVTDTNYSRTYHYDEFGNQSIQSYSGISPVGFAPLNSGGNPFNPATNHLTAVDAAGGYDARGVSIDGGSTVAIGAFGGGNPAGGQSGLNSTTITETTWVQGGGSTSPQNTEATLFSPGASANINYYPQASSWVPSGIRQYVSLSDDDPLGGSYAGALSLVGQNIDGQYNFIVAVVGGSALVGSDCGERSCWGRYATRSCSEAPRWLRSIGEKL